MLLGAGRAIVGIGTDPYAPEKVLNDIFVDQNLAWSYFFRRIEVFAYATPQGYIRLKVHDFPLKSTNIIIISDGSTL